MQLVSWERGRESGGREKGGTYKDTKRDYLISLTLCNNQDVRSEFPRPGLPLAPTPDSSQTHHPSFANFFFPLPGDIIARG